MSIKLENTKNELIGIYDEKNNLIGTADRKEMRAKNLIHRATNIIVINHENKILVQRRSELKEYCPAYLDLAVGGVLGVNEEADICAEREVEEEIGIIVKDTKAKKLTPYSVHYFAEEICRCWHYCYYIHLTKEEADKIYFKDNEVSAIFWYTKDELNKMIEERKEKMTNDSIYNYQMFLKLVKFP